MYLVPLTFGEVVAVVEATILVQVAQDLAVLSPQLILQ
jgi:hypothetical protein